MKREEVINAYFEWLFDLVCKNRYSNQISYRKLLMQLHDTEFTYQIPKDENRAEDGINLRYRFALDHGFSDLSNYLVGPCSVLEMLIALSIRCEESIMDNPNIGNRTGQWFWGMIVNLGLGSMIDNNFDKVFVEKVVGRFLDRQYGPDGDGGLFTIRNCNVDLRGVEIWYQLCWYLDTIT